MNISWWLLKSKGCQRKAGGSVWIKIGSGQGTSWVMLNDTDTDTFPVPNIFDTDTSTFFGTKFFGYPFQDFFRYQFFLIPIPIPPKKWKIHSTGTKLAINGALFGKHTKFGIIQFRIGEKNYKKVGEKIGVKNWWKNWWKSWWKKLVKKWVKKMGQKIDQKKRSK